MGKGQISNPFLNPGLLYVRASSLPGLYLAHRNISSQILHETLQTSVFLVFPIFWR